MCLILSQLPTSYLRRTSSTAGPMVSQSLDLEYARRYYWKRIHGGDLKDVWRRLQSLDPGVRTSELIRNQLTSTFLEGLSRRPGFRRLFLCSPWISLNERQRQLLTNAVLRESDQNSS